MKDFEKSPGMKKQEKEYREKLLSLSGQALQGLLSNMSEAERKVNSLGIEGGIESLAIAYAEQLLEFLDEKPKWLKN